MFTRLVTLKVDDLNIAGQLFLPEGQMPYATVCVCHGIPARLPDPTDRGYPLLAERICRQGFAVFLFNFRGTGASSGNLDILGWTRDLKAAINYLCTLPELDRSNLTLLGFSAGAAVSVYVAAQDSRVTSLAICACPAEFTFSDEPQSLIDRFRSLGTFRDEGFPQSVEAWFSGFRIVSPIKYIAKLAPRPLLIVHGKSDEVVAVSHAYRLYEKAGEPKRLITVDSAGHRLRQNEQAMALVIDWLNTQKLTGR